jgi:hypothetical protein
VIQLTLKFGIPQTDLLILLGAHGGSPISLLPRISVRA